jgi:hypothetical protein
MLGNNRKTKAPDQVAAMKWLATVPAFARPGQTAAPTLIEAILDERPDLRGKNISAPWQGQCAYTVFIGGEVFKGSLSPAAKSLQEEWRYLFLLEKGGVRHSPRLTCIGKKAHFFGMPYQKGKAFNKWKLMPGQKEAFGAQIAEFCHDTNRALMRAKEFNKQADQIRRQSTLPDVLENDGMKRLMGDGDWALCRRAAQVFQDTQDPVLINSDIKPEHYLVDKKGGLAAVLDFNTMAFQTVGEICARARDEFGSSVVKGLRRRYAELDPVRCPPEEDPLLRLYQCIQGDLTAMHQFPPMEDSLIDGVKSRIAKARRALEGGLAG